MNYLLRAALAAALSLPLSAADYRLELKPDATQIRFTLGDVLHTVNGTFRLKRGAIEFDTATGKASGEIVVDVASGESGSGARDSRMHANVLESKKYPEATFAPESVEGALAVPGASSVKLRGKFTIHGATHDAALDVRATATEDRLTAAIGFDLPYVAWGMKDPSNFLLKVEKTVKLTIDASGPLEKR